MESSNSVPRTDATGSPNHEPVAVVAEAPPPTSAEAQRKSRRRMKKRRVVPAPPPPPKWKVAAHAAYGADSVPTAVTWRSGDAPATPLEHALPLATITRRNYSGAPDRLAGTLRSVLESELGRMEAVNSLRWGATTAVVASPTRRPNFFGWLDNQPAQPARVYATEHHELVLPQVGPSPAVAGPSIEDKEAAWYGTATRVYRKAPPRIPRPGPPLTYAAHPPPPKAATSRPTTRDSQRVAVDAAAPQSSQGTLYYRPIRNMTIQQFRGGSSPSVPPCPRAEDEPAPAQGEGA